MSEYLKFNVLDLIDDLPDDSPRKVPLRNAVETVVAEHVGTVNRDSVYLVPSGIPALFAVGVVSEPHPDLVRRVIGSEGAANLELGRVDREARSRGGKERHKMRSEDANKLTVEIKKAYHAYSSSHPEREIVSLLARKFQKHSTTIRRHLKKECAS